MYNKFVDVYSKYLKSDTTDDFWLVDSIKTKHFLFNVGSSSFMNFRLIQRWITQKSETRLIKHTIAKKDIVERSKDGTGNNIFPGTAPPLFHLLLVQKNIIVVVRKLRGHPLVLVLCSQGDSRQPHFPIPVFLEPHQLNSDSNWTLCSLRCSNLRKLSQVATFELQGCCFFVFVWFGWTIIWHIQDSSTPKSWP